MEIKLFYKSQDEVAKAINNTIDSYWQNEINEERMVQTIYNLIENNESKVLKGDEFTSVIKQKCGKRRLEVVTRLLKMR